MEGQSLPWLDININSNNSRLVCNRCWRSASIAMGLYRMSVVITWTSTKRACWERQAWLGSWTRQCLSGWSFVHLEGSTLRRVTAFVTRAWSAWVNKEKVNISKQNIRATINKFPEQYKMIISFSRNRFVRGLFRSVLFGLSGTKDKHYRIHTTTYRSPRICVYTFFALRRWRIAVTFSRHQFFNSTTHDRAPFVCEGLVVCVNCRLRRRFPYTADVQYFFNRPAGVTFSPAIRRNKKIVVTWRSFLYFLFLKGLECRFFLLLLSIFVFNLVGNSSRLM